MKYSSRLNRTAYLVSWLMAACVMPQANAQQKDILERKTSVYFQSELLTTFDFINFYGLDFRHSLGASRQISPKMEAGLRIMTANSSMVNYWETDVYPFHDPELVKEGFMKSKGLEFNIRKYHKVGCFVPYGRFFEFSLGFHRSVAGPNTYNQVEYNHPNPVLVKITEVERVFNSTSIGVKFGKQWLFDNNLFINAGLSIKWQFMRNVSFDQKFKETNFYLDSPSLFTYSVLTRDLLVTFASVGYFF